MSADQELPYSSNQTVSPEQPVQLSQANPLAAMEPGEQLIAEITRHPFGLISTYMVGGILLALVATAAIAAPMIVTGNMHHQILLVSVVGFMVLAALILLAMYITTKVYKGNRWIITSDSLTQINQVSLFSRQSSQLSLHNLEDVTVQQNGILQSSMNFGTLRAETAGERSKFVFIYCPDPNARAREILLARERFMGEGSFVSKTNNNSTDDPGVNINTQ